MVDFVEVLNKYYVEKRGKRIKQDFREVLGKEVEDLSQSEKQIYDIYIEPNLTQLQDTLYEAYKDSDKPLEEWRAAILENPPSIMNGIAKKTVIRAIRDAEIEGP